MSFNMQSTPNYWNDDTHHQQPNNLLYDDICELNQENMNLFNTQHQQNQQYQYQQQQYPFFNNDNLNNNLYSNNPTSNIDSNVYHTENSQQQQPPNIQQPPVFSHSSSESSPNFKVESQHSLMSPGTSEASGHHIEEAVAKNKTRKFSSVKNKKQLLDEQDAILISKDDSELNEEELQLKRKAQNRAAQRAFRERKETKLKDLEAKLLKSEEERQKLMDQLEIIRKHNFSISTENEALKNDSSHSFSQPNYHQSNDKFNFPRNQDDFINGIIQGTKHIMQDDHKNKVYDDNDGNKVLALGAVWDYLQIKAEEANLDFNSIDINEVMNKLKGSEKCHGFGPAYDKKAVDLAIKSCLSN